MTGTAVVELTETKTRKPRSTREETLKTKANKFVPAALKALAKVASLADYEPSQEQREKILSVFSEAFAELRDALEPTPVEHSAETEFTI
jgi:hypothetical protein